uniref:EGF-like domain-containing protein n=1 Tax=Oryzias latipes TaxID=8090 RepID=A0A3P9JA40_ORYLA
MCTCHKPFTKHNHTCKTDSQRHLYIADDNEIRSLDPSVSNWRYEQIFQGDANVRIDAMDLHVKTNRIYWTNWHTRRISSYDLPSSSTSSQNSNRNRRQSDTRVTNLDVSLYMDPQRGHIEIEVFRYGWYHEGDPRLAVDYFNERLYWADAKLSLICSVRLNGSDAVVAVNGVKNNLHHPFSIDIFEDYIYGVTYINNHVFRVNKFGKGQVEDLTTGLNHATDVVLYNRYKQPEEGKLFPNSRPFFLSPVDQSAPVPTDARWTTAHVWSCLLPRCPLSVSERAEMRVHAQTNARPWSVTDTWSPTAPPSGPCSIQCMNGGSCFLNAHKQPKCRCQPNFGGERCEVDQSGSCEGYCLNKGTCLQRDNGSMVCRCPPQFTGSTCEIDRCHYCRDGTCIPSDGLSSTGEVTCRCKNGRIQPSCYTCDTNGYCANGQCFMNLSTRLPEWTASIVVTVMILLLLVLLGVGALLWYRRRMKGAKGFQHQRMTNGAMNVEIGNPAYKIYEGEPDDDAGELLDADFTLDPDKPTNFTNPVYATLYMGAHNSRNSLASTDEKKELLSRGDEERLVDPLA